MARDVPPSHTHKHKSSIFLFATYQMGIVFSLTPAHKLYRGTNMMMNYGVERRKMCSFTRSMFEFELPLNPYESRGYPPMNCPRRRRPPPLT
ncbi:hypothetical protein L249_7802 [Ophiocordyceps polyrhachis-furcata BCC 54312]|uniref:Uncharacterized protein n=1 Tax=Ophiocordyceps polyrhachis-furcata BCC 54312 TaxID=1330021 RepID=A0A367L0W3_9HYPO|nr:hypothetical protein L249_7802 [Ophiocordyceps polyrhachis-furcata BCC 54312]